jgi:nucleolar protein 14
VQAAAATAVKSKKSLGISAEAEDDCDVDDDDRDVDGSSSDDGAPVDGADGTQSDLSLLDVRRAARAAGDNPLQKGIRTLTAQLLLKHGMQPSKQSLQELNEGVGACGSACAGSKGSELSSHDEDADEDEDDDERSSQDAGVSKRLEGKLDPEDAADVDAQLEAAHSALLEHHRRDGGRLSGAAEQAADTDEDRCSSEGEDDEMGRDRALVLLQDAISIKEKMKGGAVDGGAAIPVPPRARAGTEACERNHRLQARPLSLPDKAVLLEAGGATSSHTEDVSDDISFTPPLPKDYASFARMVSRRCGADAVTLVQRIRAFHAATLAADHKVRLQGLYNCVVQHFAEVAGARPLNRDVLDSLTPLLVTMTLEVPLYAASLARTLLLTMYHHFNGCLKSPECASAAQLLVCLLPWTVEDACCLTGLPAKSHANAVPWLRRSLSSGWPGQRGLILLRLFSVLFPSSDRKHAVCTPLSLVLGFLLSGCPLHRPADVAAGLFVAALLQHIASSGARYSPEVTPFCEVLLHSAVMPKQRVDEGTLCCGHMQLGKGWLAEPTSPSLKGGGSSPVAPLATWQYLSTDASDPYFASPAFRAAALQTVLCLVAGQAAALQACAPESLPAAMLPLERGLARVTQHGAVAGSLRAGAKKLLEDMRAAAAASVAARRPLASAWLMQKMPQKLLNPKFEMEFDKHKDYDPDREGSEFKQYKRMAAKEQRGAPCMCRRCWEVAAGCVPSADDVPSQRSACGVSCLCSSFCILCSCHCVAGQEPLTMDGTSECTAWGKADKIPHHTMEPLASCTSCTVYTRHYVAVCQMWCWILWQWALIWPSAAHMIPAPSLRWSL